MAKQVVDIGSVIANGADGDTAREAFTKVNANFTEVYDNVQSQTQAVNNKVDKVVGKSLVDDTEIAKLLTVNANATQNSADSFLLDRANHIGTQSTSTISGLDTQLSGFENKLTPGSNITIDRADPLNPVISASASSGLTNPMTSEGDIIIGDVGGSPIRLGIGGAGQVLTTVSGKPSWQSPSGGAGTGDVVGPASSVNNEVALFDGITGKAIKAGGVLGTAAFTDSTAYATFEQGLKAETAVQPAVLSDYVLDSELTTVLAPYALTSSLGTAAFTESVNYATSAQGAKADSSLQPSTIGVTIQGYSANLSTWSLVSTSEKQDTLVSATNIKTINGASVLGPGNLTVSGVAVWGSITGTLSDQADLQSELDSKVDDSLVDFTIIYPNGGSDGSPGNVALNSRYVEVSPFPGHAVLCKAEILLGGVWGDSGLVLSGSAANGGVIANQLGDNIVVQTGQAIITGNSNVTLSPFGRTAGNVTTPTPCRVKVWKVKGVIA